MKEEKFEAKAEDNTEVGVPGESEGETPPTEGDPVAPPPAPEDPGPPVEEPVEPNPPGEAP